MLASVSRTYSNPATVAALIRVNGLDSVRRTGLVPRECIRQVRRGLKAHAFDEYRTMLAERRRGSADWRMLKFARRHGHECLAAAERRPHDARLVAGLTDSWIEHCSAGEIGRRHGWDVGFRLSRMTRVSVYAKAADMGMDLELIEALQHKRLMQQEASPVLRRLQVGKRVMARTCRLFGVTPAELCSDIRERKFAVPRFFYCYWMRRVTGWRDAQTGKRVGVMSYPEIGRRLGGRDHTTALNGERKWPSSRERARKLIEARQLLGARDGR